MSDPYVEITPDITYVAQATAIAARDLDLISVAFCNYISREGTEAGVVYATAYIQWLAESAILIWEKMVSVHIAPVEISHYYERGMEFVSLLGRLGLYDESLLLQDRWDAILVRVQESRNIWGEGVPVDFPGAIT